MEMAKTLTCKKLQFVSRLHGSLSARKTRMIVDQGRGYRFILVTRVSRDDSATELGSFFITRQTNKTARSSILDFPRWSVANSHGIHFHSLEVARFGISLTVLTTRHRVIIITLAFLLDPSRYDGRSQQLSQLLGTDKVFRNKEKVLLEQK